MTNSTGQSWSRSFEPNRDLITAVSNFWESATVSSFGYSNDALGRRTARTDFNGSVATPNAFGYNQRSEVTNATMGANTYGYDNDAIGNRKTASESGASGLSTYSANALNQYTSISNGQSAVTCPAYDADGNMTSYGPWTFTWDAENRLANAFSNGVLIAANAYDHRSRRIRKTVGDDAHIFLYDGWNMTAEMTVDTATSATNITCYGWGLDLSGSLQGAGGVGGLLSVTTVSLVPAINLNTYYPAFDANGNVTAYLDSTGTVVARREYDAFGKTISCSGSMVGDFAYWFSTKYLDPETGMYYYGYRFYSPDLGRWVNRDPIEEGGGVNIFCFARNSALYLFDLVGLKWTQNLEGSDFYLNYQVAVAGTPTQMGTGVDVFKGGSAHFEFPDWKAPEFDTNSDGCPCVKEGTGILNVHVKWWEVHKGVPSLADFHNTDGWKMLKEQYTESALRERTDHVGTISDSIIGKMNWHEKTEVGMNEILYNNTLKISEERIAKTRCPNPSIAFAYKFQLKKFINYDLAKNLFERNTRNVADKFDRNFGFGSNMNDREQLVVVMPRPPSEFKLSDYMDWLKPDIWKGTEP
jgi:RHS repeat-associated protein